MQNEASRVSLGAVHTHTHTSTFRKIKRVANEATLFGVKNRLCVVLYLGKNVVLEIACFLRGLEMRPEVFLLQQDYVNYKEFLCNCNYLEILVKCFSCYLKHIIEKLILMRKSYTRIITKFNEAEIGGVA